MKHKRTNRAFTLIELLVVIAIIGLLATLATIAFSNSRMKARDAKRIADLKALQAALQLYYDANGEYPHADSRRSSYAYPASWIPNLVADGYIAELPVDPVNSGSSFWSTGNYTYSYSSTASVNYQDYQLITQLEDPNNPNRCELKCWPFRADPGGRDGQVWCGNQSSYCSGTQNYTNYIYADH